MKRSLFLLVSLSPCLLVSFARADAFDYYINPILAKAPQAEGVKEIKQLSADLATDNIGVLPGVSGAMLVVKTNEGRWSKLLVQAGKRAVDPEKKVWMLLIERAVTYKEGTEQTVLASGNNVNLFPGFRYSLDICQVVPEDLGGDLKFVVDGDKVYAEPIGKAKMYLLTKPIPEAKPKKTEKIVVGEKYDPKWINGTYQLYDDGRRSGRLVLKLEEGGEISGSYYSDKDGEKYDVKGKLGQKEHQVLFTIKFPRAEQNFTGWLFTGNAKVLTGSSKLLDREAGFYAIRAEEE